MSPTQRTRSIAGRTAPRCAPRPASWPPVARTHADIANALWLSEAAVIDLLEVSPQ